MSGDDPLKLQFRPRARIIRTIGDQLISGPEAAVIELVKNAYDADATFVSIRMTPAVGGASGRITVEDNGHGMTLSDIQEKWMEPATSSKAVERRSPGRQRLMMGSKGIGRFAAAKLGGKLLLRSVSDRTGDRLAIIVGEIDWSVFDGDTYLADVAIDFATEATDDPTGTELEIRELGELWSRDKLERLLLELRRLISPIDAAIADDEFRIFLDLSAFTPETSGFNGVTLVEGTGGQDEPDGSQFAPHQVRPYPLLKECDYEVIGAFDSAGAFTGTMEIRRAGQQPEPMELKVELLPGEESCGPVGVRFLIFDREAEAMKTNMARAGMGNLTAAQARSILDNVTGVAVYRDGFRVRPYGDPENDWLTLDTRRVNNPSLRIGHNQIAGYLTLEGQSSGSLIEKSSREGFENNGAYRRLQHLVGRLLAERVEPRRQTFREKAGLSRTRATTFDEVRKLAELRQLRKFADTLGQAEKEEANSLIDSEASKLAERIAALEDRHRILEARSSLGAILAEVLHEGEPPVGYIVTTSRRLLRLWQEIRSNSEDAAEAAEEFPKKLAYMRDNGEILSNLFDALTPLAGGRRSTPPIPFYPTEPVAKAADVFAHSVSITVHGGPGAPKVIGYPDDLLTAMTNLLKNASHWLSQSGTSDPRVDIRFSATANKVRIDVDDNGPGVPSEFVERIFDAGFTLKEGGTGLGLNIAQEALARSQAVLGHDPDHAPGTRFTIIMDRDRPGG